MTPFDGIISATLAKVIWVGTIEISYLDYEDSDKRKNAFTVVTDVGQQRGRVPAEMRANA